MREGAGDEGEALRQRMRSFPARLLSPPFSPPSSPLLHSPRNRHRHKSAGNSAASKSASEEAGRKRENTLTIYSQQDEE